MHKFAERFAVLVLVTGLTGPTALHAEETPSLDQVRQETRELVDALQNYGADQRDRALRETEAALARLDARLQALEARVDARWQAMDAKAREEARQGLRELRRQRIELAEWYGGLRNSSAKAWGSVKQGFAEAYTALQDAWREAADAYD